jgi:hypothetical protein
MHWMWCIVAILLAFAAARLTCPCPSCPPLKLDHQALSEGEHSLALISRQDEEILRLTDGLTGSQQPYFSYDMRSNRLVQTQ